MRPRNGPPLAVKQQAGDLATRRGGRAQALVQGAVLAVDRHQLGARRRPQRLHDRAGRDQALLVRQRQPLALAQRGDRHRQTGEADDRVDDDVGVLDEVGEVVDDRRIGQGGGDLGPPGRIADRDDTRMQLLGLGDEGLDRRADAQPDDLVARFGADDVDRLRADRTGRAGDGDPDYFVQGSSHSVT